MKYDTSKGKNVHRQEQKYYERTNQKYTYLLTNMVGHLLMNGDQTTYTMYQHSSHTHDTATHLRDSEHKTLL